MGTELACDEKAACGFREGEEKSLRQFSYGTAAGEGYRLGRNEEGAVGVVMVGWMKLLRGGGGLGGGGGVRTFVVSDVVNEGYQTPIVVLGNGPVRWCDGKGGATWWQPW